MQAFRRSAGSRGLRRVPLGLAQLGHGDGKLSELSDEHHHSGLVLVAHRRRERKQSGGGPQPVPGRCGPGDPTEAAPSRAGIAVCRLPKRPLPRTSAAACKASEAAQAASAAAAGSVKAHDRIVWVARAAVLLAPFQMWRRSSALSRVPGRAYGVDVGPVESHR
jgi:hypothetical protein